MKTTKTKVLAILVLALGLMVCPAELAGAATIGTAFTYQGRLVDDNSVANGQYDFQFKVFDNPDVNLGNQQGSTIYINGLNVIDGNFTVELDFGSGIFTGDARWLEIGVRPGGSTDSFTILSPLQEVKPTPYSIHATHALQADEADTLNGLDSSAFAVTAHSHDGVYALIGHTHSGSDITTGTVADRLIAASIARDSEITWGNLAGIPVDFADGIDNIGGTDSDWIISLNNMYSGVAGNVGIGTSSPLSKLSVGGDGIAQTGVYGSGVMYGMYGSGNNFGVYGSGSIGVQGYGKTWGVIGIDSDTGSYGRLGSDTYGGYFFGDGYFSGNVGIGMTSPEAKLDVESLGGTAVSGESYGMRSKVYGSDEGDSYGIYSEGNKYSSDTAGTAYGGYFIGDNDRDSGESYGLYTKATGADGHRYGLYSEVTTTTTNYHRGNNFGLYTEVANNNLSSYGLYADLEPGEYGYGVYVDLDTTTESTGDQYGFYSNVNHQGTSGFAIGIKAVTRSSDSGGNVAGTFLAFSRPGDTGSLIGIAGFCNNETSGPKFAGYFEREGGGDYAGYFIGNVHIAGTLTKSSGSFKIDHPLDPENKYLSHSFVESPDMMNVYNGNAALDENGEACVQLPEYCEALNRDFRYQLTAIGAPAPNLYIAEKISDNRFKIAGGKPGMEVSWQVTGVRHDPYAVAHRVQVEEEKKDEERGYYLNPMAYGLPEEKGIESVRNPRVSETRQVAKGDVSYETD